VLLGHKRNTTFFRAMPLLAYKKTEKIAINLQGWNIYLALSAQ
jgi:hypothetical protein